MLHLARFQKPSHLLALHGLEFPPNFAAVPVGVEDDVGLEPISAVLVGAGLEESKLTTLLALGLDLMNVVKSVLLHWFRTLDM